MGQMRYTHVLYNLFTIVGKFINCLPFVKFVDDQIFIYCLKHFCALANLSAISILQMLINNCFFAEAWKISKRLLVLTCKSYVFIGRCEPPY